MRKTAFLLLAILGSSIAFGQAAPKMRTRLLTSLTNTEIEQYLQRNDVIFIPVGTVEPHGGMPLDCEYVGPLAYAMKFAEANDGLVFPGLTYFFPDATIVGRGGVHVTPSEGTAYLKAIARSLIRQGFRRQVYITGHQPSWETVSPLVREIYDETHVPITFVESIGMPAPGKTPNIADFDKTTIASYAITGRLNDVPVGISQAAPTYPLDPGTEYLFTLGPPSGTIGFYFPDATVHGGPVKPITPEQRADSAKQGTDLIDQEVKRVDMPAILQAMRDHDKFTQEHMVPKYGWMLSGK